MTIRERIERFFDGWMEKAAPRPSVPMEPTQKPPACPYPLTSDNGTVADCRAKNHCMCKEPK